jgi:hypothetical protein
MRIVVPLAVGCALVGIVAVVLAIVGWDRMWWAVANVALALLLLALFRGSVTGDDVERPPGDARVSAARWAGPLDPDTLGEEEARLGAGREAAAETRAEDLDAGFSYLWTAAAPAAAAALGIVFAF